MNLILQVLKLAGLGPLTSSTWRETKEPATLAWYQMTCGLLTGGWEPLI